MLFSRGYRINKNKALVGSEEFIQLRITNAKERLFPGHETTTFRRVYPSEGKRGIIAVRFIAKVGAETSRWGAV